MFWENNEGAERQWNKLMTEEPVWAGKACCFPTNAGDEWPYDFGCKENETAALEFMQVCSLSTVSEELIYKAYEPSSRKTVPQNTLVLLIKHQLGLNDVKQNGAWEFPFASLHLLNTSCSS